MEHIKYYLIVILSSLLLVACGGGSDSGSGSIPDPVISDIPDGTYTGTRTITFTYQGESFDPQVVDFGLTVTGQFEGQQQVVIQFIQWSGSSAIVEPSNTFSISTGTFPVESQFNGLCQVSGNFEGAFVTNTASGTANYTWTCEDLSDVLTSDITFEVTLENDAGNAKTFINQMAIPNVR